METINQKHYGKIDIDGIEKDIVQVSCLQGSSFDLIQIEREHLKEFITALSSHLPKEEENAWICLNCKECFGGNEPKSCSCGGSTFGKTHPSNAPKEENNFELFGGSKKHYDSVSSPSPRLLPDGEAMSNKLQEFVDETIGSITFQEWEKICEKMTLWMRSLAEPIIQAKDERIKDLEKVSESLYEGIKEKGDEIAELKDVLSELVTLKEIKDLHGKTDDYLKRQPIAWDKAKQQIKTLTK